MSKSLKICIAVAAMLAVAAPAMAQVKFSGVFAVQGYHQNFDADVAGGTHNEVSFALADGDKKNSHSFIDQRFRPKVDYKLNDYVSLTYFAEIDTVWGEGGGVIGTDGINVETKQIFVDFKIPDTASKARIGLQYLNDPFQNIIFADDMAAVNVSGKLGPVDYQAIYAKFNEGAGTENGLGARFNADDVDLYGLTLGHKYGDFASAGVSAYYLNHNGAATRGLNSGFLATDDARELWWLGINGDYRFANFAVEGFFVYQFGEFTEVNVDNEAFAASIKGRMVIPNGDLGLRYIYFSDNDEDTASDYNAWAGSMTNGGGHEFAGENMMIFLVDRDVMNVGKNRFAMRDAVAAGYGLHAVIATGNFKNLPMGTFANVGIGGFWAAEDTIAGDPGTKVNGKTLGYEVTAKVGKMFAEKFELSLRGSYAMIGEFYEDQAFNNNDPDDAYTVALMARVPF